MKELGLINECDVESLFINNSLDIKKSRVSLDSSKADKNKFGSLVIFNFFNLDRYNIFIWNKNTYYELLN